MRIRRDDYIDTLEAALEFPPEQIAMRERPWRERLRFWRRQAEGNQARALRAAREIWAERKRAEQ